MTAETRRTLLAVFRFVVALGFLVPGVMHFTHAHIFVAMMPPYLPWHLELVWLSGVFEIAGAIGLLIPQTRRAAAWGLLALLVAVFPANLHMALNDIVLPVEGATLNRTANWARLPFQLVFAAEVWAVGLWRPDWLASSHSDA